MTDKAMTVLVIEDMKHWTDLIGLVLGQMGYTVRAALNSEEARAALDSGPYRLAVVDVRLVDADYRDKSGLDLVREAWARRCVGGFLIWSGNWTVDMIRKDLGREIPDRVYRVVDKADIDSLNQLKELLEVLLKESANGE